MQELGTAERRATLPACNCTPRLCWGLGGFATFCLFCNAERAKRKWFSTFTVLNSVFKITKMVRCVIERLLVGAASRARWI